MNEVEPILRTPTFQGGRRIWASRAHLHATIVVSPAEMQNVQDARFLELEQPTIFTSRAAAGKIAGSFRIQAQVNDARAARIEADAIAVVGPPFDDASFARIVASAESRGWQIDAARSKSEVTWDGPVLELRAAREDELLDAGFVYFSGPLTDFGEVSITGDVRAGFGSMRGSVRVASRDASERLVDLLTAG